MLKPLGKPSAFRGMKGTIVCMVISLILCLGLTCNFGMAATSHSIGLQTGTTVRLATSNFHTGDVESLPKEKGHLKTRLARQVQLDLSKEDHEDKEEVHQVGDEEQVSEANEQEFEVESQESAETRTNGIKDKKREKESVESKSKETEEEVSKSDIQRTTPGDQKAEKLAQKLDDDSQEAELEEQGQVGIKKSAAEAETHDSETQEQEAEAEKFDGDTEVQESTDSAELGERETKGQDKESIKEQWEIEREEEQNNDASDTEGPKAKVGKQKTSRRWYGSDAETEEGEVQEEVASRSREHEDEGRDDKSGGQEEGLQIKKENERGVGEESREAGAEKESEETRDEIQKTVEKIRVAEEKRQKAEEARREAEEVSRGEEEGNRQEVEEKREAEEEKREVEEIRQEVEIEKQDPDDAIEEAENKSREEGGVEKNDRTPDHEDIKRQRADEEKLESKEETQDSGEEKGVAKDESKEKDEAEIRENEIEYQDEDDDRASKETNTSTEDEMQESEAATHVGEEAEEEPADDSQENKSETDRRRGSKRKNSDGEERWKKPQDTNKTKPTAAPKTKIKEKKAAVAEKPRRMKGKKTTAAPGTAESAKSRQFVGKTTFIKPRAEKDTQGMIDSSAEAPEVEEEEGAKRGRPNERHRDRLMLRDTNSPWVSDKFIAAINSKQTEWKADRNFRADIRSKVLKRLVGERLGSSISWSEKFHSILPSVWTTLKGALMSYIVTPESYDLRDETDCVMRPLDTGLAATSWALSTAQSVEDRWCGMMSASPGRTFSSQYLINCCDACTDQSSTNAGSPMEAYNFMQRIGIPGKDCKPHSSSPVMRTLGAGAVSTKVQVPRIVNGCSSECDESDLPFVFTDLCKIRSYHYIVPGWASSIKHEIRNRGSVTAEVTVYTDFLNYKEGVYSPVEGAEPFGDLTLRLIGWNGSHSQLHWLAVGVWGKKWGDRGMVKLRAFDPRLNMESRVSVSTVDGTQCKEAQQPEVAGFTIEASDVVQRRLAKIRSRLSKAHFMSSQSLVGLKKRHRR